MQDVKSTRKSLHSLQLCHASKKFECSHPTVLTAFRSKQHRVRKQGTRADPMLHFHSVNGELAHSCPVQACAAPSSHVGIQEILRIYLHQQIGTPRYRTQFVIGQRIADNSRPWTRLVLCSMLQRHLDIQVLVRAYTQEGSARLADAVRRQNAKRVKSILEAFADPNIRTRRNDIEPRYAQPLQLAVHLEDYTIAKMLLLAAADVNKRIGQFVEPPLLTATRNQDLKMTQLLICSRADPNLSDVLQILPLEVAIYHQSLKMLRLLLCSRADPNLRNYVGDAPLHHCIKYGNTGTISSTATLLLRFRADLRVESRCDKLTPLGLAVQWGQSKAARLLLKHRALLHEKAASRSALHIAAEKGSAAFLRLLIEARADVNATDASDQVPLQVLRRHPHFRDRIACRRLLRQ